MPKDTDLHKSAYKGKSFWSFLRAWWRRSSLQNRPIVVVEAAAMQQPNETWLPVSLPLGDAEKVALFLDQGQDVDSKGAQNRTPLHRAVWVC